MHIEGTASRPERVTVLASLIELRGRRIGRGAAGSGAG